MDSETRIHTRVSPVADSETNEPLPAVQPCERLKLFGKRAAQDRSRLDSLPAYNAAINRKSFPMRGISRLQRDAVTNPEQQYDP